jgi:hypothetical protein
LASASTGILPARNTAKKFEPPGDGFSREIIRIHPDWTKSFNLPAVSD